MGPQKKVPIIGKSGKNPLYLQLQNKAVLAFKMVGWPSG